MDMNQHSADTSYYRQPSTSQPSIIRPTQGFAWESSGSFGSAAEREPYPPSQQDTRYIESSSVRRPKDKPRSKDKHKSKHRSRDEYPAVNNHTPRDYEAPSSPNTRNDVPAPQRQSSTAYPTHTDYQPSLNHSHDPRSSNHDMQRQSQPTRNEARHYSREPSLEYAPAPHRSYSPDYRPQSPVDESNRQESSHQKYVQEPEQDRQSPSPPPAHEVQYQSPEAAPGSDNSKQRALRLVTLLIEDIRLKESQLAEVYVPLSHRSGGQIWADAVDVTDALQSGPSRIDGSAKVSTTRSGFKQIFFRVTANGEVICKPANLQLTPQKTLSVLVEDPDIAIALLQRASSGMLTPSTETMTVSPGIPRPITPLPADRLDSQKPYHYDSELEARRPSSSRKRRRSISRDMGHPSEQQERSRQPYHEISPTTRDHRPSRPTAQNDSSNTARSSPDSSSGSGSDTSSHSGSGAYQNTQPPQISPLSQAGTLVQMSPGSISDPNTTPSRSTLETYPNQQRVSGASPVPRTSYSPHNAPSQRYPPPAEQQRPPSKKPRQDAYVSSTPQGQPSSNDTRTSSNQPPMASLTPPPSRPVSNPTAQSAGGFASYSNVRTTYGATSTVSSTPPAVQVQRSSASAGRPTPVAVSGPPAAGVQSDPKVDDAVALYLRGMFKQEPAFSAYLEARNKNLPVSQWIKHLEYVQTKFEQYVGNPVPEGIDGVGSAITKTQLCRAFYQSSATWGEECLEVIALSKLYGPGGTRMVDPDAVDLYNEPEGVTTTLQMRRYLGLLRNIHGKWLEEHS